MSTEAENIEAATQDSLGIFLRRQLLRSRLRALVVTNADGELLGFCGDGVDPERAAALAPAIFHQEVEGGDSLTARLWVDAIPMGEDTVYVFSLGEGDRATVDHEATRKGIRRILEDRD